MNKNQLKRWRSKLLEYSARVQGTAGGLEDQTRQPTGSGSNISNAPMHLGDVGTEVYLQEMNATLLENENHILMEVTDALGRIDRGTFGICENCGKPIPEGRLEVVPYARYCVPCTEALGDEPPANLNRGRPDTGPGAIPRKNTRPTAETDPLDLDRDPVVRADRESDGGPDVHAAGTAGGGTAVGGLAGTNIGEGGPADAGLEEAMGTGNFDVEANADQDDEAYAGPSGGAVGGTPANKRATGGRTGRGVAPHSDTA
ncbi:MAG: TraR/DksA C4-type zinc finger protein [Zavarzinella sp.]|nr:TraR/DksA C4-type zinc finger protein [Zavarzinella sp.]